jgi:hypothetical protein
MTILVPPRAHANIACAVEGFSLSAPIGGTRQVMTATVLTPSVADGDVVVTVTAAGMAGTPKDVTVTVADKDTVADVAAKLAAALAADAGVTAFFDVTAAAAAVTLTRKTHAANDATMKVALKTDASNTGVTVNSAVTAQGALATSCTITLTPEVAYAAPPVLVGAPQHVKGQGSAATSMTWALTAQAKTGVTITCTLDQAPGAGVTDTIVFSGGLIGVPAR